MWNERFLLLILVAGGALADMLPNVMLMGSQYNTSRALCTLASYVSASEV